MNDEVRAVLERPFLAQQLRSRRAASGKSLTYVETHSYIERLNEAYDGRWDFVVLEHEVVDTEVVVLGRLSADGVTKTAFGGSKRTKSRDSGEAISLADDLKAAASDALKKCCSLLGLGLHLYGEVAATTGSHADSRPQAQQPQPRRSGVNTQTLTSRQYAAILAIAERIGLDEASLLAQVKELYGAPLDALDRRSASELITRLGSNGNGNGSNVKAAQGGAA